MTLKTGWCLTAPNEANTATHAGCPRIYSEGKYVCPCSCHGDAPAAVEAEQLEDLGEVEAQGVDTPAQGVYAKRVPTTDGVQTLKKSRSRK